jgi:quinolinate synthase
MFSLAMSAKRRGMGVVGSTSNILDFITAKVSRPCVNQHQNETPIVTFDQTGNSASLQPVRSGQSAPYAARVL